MIDSKRIKMETTKLKSKIIDKVKEADDNLLQEIDRFIEHYESEEIVAYTVTGEPLNLSKYKKQIEDAEEQIKNGQYISHEDLKKEVRSWKK